jgi:hypothetical protein
MLFLFLTFNRRLAKLLFAGRSSQMSNYNSYSPLPNKYTIGALEDTGSTLHATAGTHSLSNMVAALGYYNVEIRIAKPVL